MLKQDATMLIIGLIIAMIIVALTLNVPDGPYPAFDEQCYQSCKKLASNQLREVVKSKHFLSTTKYVVEINKCMYACEEAKNENSSESMDP
jgi:hypothetical protein